MSQGISRFGLLPVSKHAYDTYFPQVPARVYKTRREAEKTMGLVPFPPPPPRRVPNTGTPLETWNQDKYYERPLSGTPDTWLSSRLPKLALDTPLSNDFIDYSFSAISALMCLTSLFLVL